MSSITKSKLKEGSILKTDEFEMTNEYREAIHLFEKFDRYELLENLGYYSTNWLLSNDDIKLNVQVPLGLCKSLPAMNYEKVVVLYPISDEQYEEFMLDYRGIYQIIRELTQGIFGCNQIPGIELEGNFDRSTYCQMPPAYINTRIGQHLIEIDYLMKSLWFGAYFPPDKRSKWNEKWKNNLQINFNGQPETKGDIFNEFVNAGQINVSKSPDYQHMYDDYKESLIRENLADPNTETIFRQNYRNIGMKMNFFVNKVAHFHDIVLFQSEWKIETVIRAIAEDLDAESTEKIAKILQLQRDLIQSNIGNQSIIRRRLFILQFICGLIPLTIGLKKRMKLPDITKLMNPLLGDEVQTDKELPPLILNGSHPNVLFNREEYFSLHGGIQFNITTPELESLDPQLQTPEFLDQLQSVVADACEIAKSESSYTDKNPVRSIKAGDQRYLVVPIHLETYYNQNPKSPNWLRAIHRESEKLIARRFAMTENAIFEQFKKIFGLSVALQNKDKVVGMRTCSRRGLVAMMMNLCRMGSITSISKQDNSGWSLMHHAAINNHVHLIGSLILQSQDINIRRYNSMTETSPTPLHVAVTTGSLAAVTALIGCNANLFCADKNGWMPVHCAAYYDQVVILHLLIRRDPTLMNKVTRDKLRQSAILLAAGSGSIDSVKLLIKVGASISLKDGEDKGVIHMAVLSFRNRIIEYFIELEDSRVKVWLILLDMLVSKNALFIQKTVECLEYLTKFTGKYWKSILENNLIPSLIALLESEDTKLLLTTTSLICNICVHEPCQIEIAKTEIIKYTINLFELKELQLKSQLAFIMSQMCKLSQCQELFAEMQGHLCLQQLIHQAQPHKPSSTCPPIIIDVAVNAVEAVTAFCAGNSTNQNKVVNDTDIVDHLIKFLCVRDLSNIEVLLAASSLAISSIVKENNTNKNIFIEKNIVRPLHDLLEPRIARSVRHAVANAVEHLSNDNNLSRESFLKLHTEVLLIHLLKIWDIEEREQAIRSLWALAGDHITGQRFIANRIGVSLLVELIMTKSEELQSIGCLAISAMYKEMKHDDLMKERGISPLVRLLRSKTCSYRVMANAVETVGILCLGIAHCNNYSAQSQLAQEGALEILVDIYNRPESGLKLKIEISYSLASLVLNHKPNEALLNQNYDFCDLMEIINTIDDRVLLLRCLTSLATFAFNNSQNQFIINERGGVSYSYFQSYLESDDPIENIQAAFNMVVLARDIKEHKQVSITAAAVNILTKNIQSKEEHVIIHTASSIASLCHTRAGIPDAFVSLGAVDYLLRLLHSTNQLVKSAVAVALGYLSFNGTAGRMMLKECRIDYTLFPILHDEVQKSFSKINEEFVQAYLKTERIGLPYKYLECNGGYPIIPSPTRIRIKSSSLKRTNRIESAKNITNQTANHSLLEIDQSLSSSNNTLKPRPFTAQYSRKKYIH